MVMAVSPACACAATRPRQAAETAAARRCERVMDIPHELTLGLKGLRCGMQPAPRLATTNCEPGRKNARNQFLECDAAQRLPDITIAAYGPCDPAGPLAYDPNGASRSCGASGPWC